VEAATTGDRAVCPNCGRVSTRVLTRYARTLTDRPLTTTPLRYRLLVKRFVRANAACRRRIFAEPLPDLASPRAGTTAGGEPGSRLARALAMPTSPDTLLRGVRAADPPAGPPPRSVGVDDWVVKNGRHYRRARRGGGGTALHPPAAEGGHRPAGVRRPHQGRERAVGLRPPAGRRHRGRCEEAGRAGGRGGVPAALLHHHGGVEPRLRCGAFPDQVVKAAAKGAVERSSDRYLKQIGG
jgi:hypothetical protein